MSVSPELRAKWAKQDKEDADLLDSLEIPEYTDRKLEAVTIKFNEGRSIVSERGWGCSVTEEIAALLPVGKTAIQESRNGRISGWVIDGKWYDRQSDQDLDRFNQKLKEKITDDYRAYYENNKDRWEAEEAVLPDWLRDVIEESRKADPEFDTAPLGWGYVLTIARLAELYYDMGEIILDKDVFSVRSHEPELISKIAREEGTSGNQHSVALGVAKAHMKLMLDNNETELRD